MKNSTSSRPSPPKHLSDEAKKWWCALVREFVIEDEAGRLLLLLAMESFDRMRQAQRQIEADGPTCRDRFGQVRAHPSLLVERDSRTALQRALKQLNLDVLPPTPAKKEVD